MANANYHGLDSNSNPNSDPCPDAFYLGELGMGGFAGDSQVKNGTLSFENCGATGNTYAYAQTERSYCSASNPCHTYAYQILLGPQFGSPTNSGATLACGAANIPIYDCSSLINTNGCYDWGNQQALAAINQWNAWSAVLSQKTIYGDIEPSSGWYAASDGVINGYQWYDLNLQVIEGFVAELQQYGFYAGIYTTQGTWNSSTNSASMVSGVTSVWCASQFSRLNTTCYPDWSTLPSNCTIGGRVADLWQYSGSASGNSQDWDACNTLHA